MKWKYIVIFFGIIAIIEGAILYNQKTWGIDLPWQLGAQISDQENYISAQGSWISDSKNGFMNYVFNTTDLACDQSRGTCFEARAYKAREGTSSLLVQRLEYQIKNWSVDEVVAVLDGLAATHEIKIDRIKKVVTWVGNEKPTAAGASKLPSYAHLGGGNEAMAAMKIR